MHQSYQLFIEISDPITIQIGRLGKFTFPAGSYVYSGSAKKRLEARINRHLRKDKKTRWHIDYILNHPLVRIVRVERSELPECTLSQQTAGQIIVPGFGSSDCRAGCGSHLKKLRPAHSPD